MSTHDRNHWKSLEVTSRLPLSRAAHPDDCMTLTVRGVDWALPPRGLRVVPRFTAGRAELERQGGRAWPGANRLVDLARRIKRTRRCPCCGGAIGAVAGAPDAEGAEFVRGAVDLAARTLRAQYDLSDEDLSELLAFEPARLPEWFGQILRWALGLHTRGIRVTPPRRRRRRRRRT